MCIGVVTILKFQTRYRYQDKYLILDTIYDTVGTKMMTTLCKLSEAVQKKFSSHINVTVSFAIAASFMIIIPSFSRCIADRYLVNRRLCGYHLIASSYS